MEKIEADVDFKKVSFLHFAPEDFFREQFRSRFAKYETADLFMENVDHKVDITKLPFADASYDFICASHVLEHIEDDRLALKEIARVLAPGGIAILPVPMVADQTVEYPEPNPLEFYHCRAPGPDYFDVYREFFSRIDEYESSSFDPRHQIYVYEDRTGWPTAEMPLRPSQQGVKHIDYVPVCYK